MVNVILVSLTNDIKIIHIKHFFRCPKMLYKWPERKRQGLKRSDKTRWGSVGGYPECILIAPWWKAERQTAWLPGFRLGGEVPLQVQRRMDRHSRWSVPVSLTSEKSPIVTGQN